MLNIYLVWWGLLLILSATDPFGLFPISYGIYAMLIINVVFFMLGFVVNNLTTQSNSKVTDINKLIFNILFEFQKLSKNKLFIIIMIIFIIMLLRYNLIYQEKVFLYGTDDARNMRFYVGDVFKSSIEIYFYTFIVEAFSIFVSLYLAFSLSWSKFNRISLLAALYIYLYSSFGAGRLYLIEMGFYIAFFYTIKKVLLKTTKHTISREVENLKGSDKRTLAILLPVFFLLYSFSIYLSNFRKGIFELTFKNFTEGNALFYEQIIIYCVGSFRALEYGITNYSLEIGNTFGRIALGGLDEGIGVLIGMLGGNYEYANSIYGKFTALEINIGYNQTYNALFTSVFGMYLDFGIIGVVGISFLWGLIFSKIIRYFQSRPNLYLMFILVFIAVVFILTVLKWKMQSPSAWIFIIAALILSKSKAVKL